MANVRHVCMFIGLVFSLLFPLGEAFAESQSVPGGPEKAGERARTSVHYHAPLTNNPSTLDPARVEDMYGVTLVQQLFDGLVRFTPSLLVSPALAQSWQVEENGRLYRFFLRRDARFHNGEVVKARDVVFSLQRLFRKEAPPAILPHLMKIQGAAAFLEGAAQQIAGLVEEDDHTVAIRLEEPYFPFLIALGMFQAKIVPRDVVTADPDRFARHPVGSGPFMFASWEPDHKISLDRFEDHWAGRALLEGIRFYIYPGSKIDAVLADFRGGKLHEMPVYGALREAIAGAVGLKTVHRPSLSLLFYGFNCEHPLLTDESLRRALSLVIDRSALVSQVYGGQFEAAEGILPPGMPGYQPHRSQRGVDLPMARELMEKYVAAGGKVPVHLEIVVNSGSAMAQAELKFIEEAWKPLGVQVTSKVILNWGEFQQYLRSDALQVFRYVWYADIPDPDSFMQPLFAGDSQNNFVRFSREELDRMIRLAQTTADPLKRAEIYASLEDAILSHSPIIPLFNLSIDSVFKPEVMGIEVSALGTHTMSYHKVWLKSSSH